MKKQKKNCRSKELHIKSTGKRVIAIVLTLALVAGIFLEVPGLEALAAEGDTVVTVKYLADPDNSEVETEVSGSDSSLETAFGDAGLIADNYGYVTEITVKAGKIDENDWNWLMDSGTIPQKFPKLQHFTVVEGVPVTDGPSKAFQNGTNLVSVSIAEITSISERFFSNCTSLVTVNCPKIKDLQVGGNFENTTSLKSIELPELNPDLYSPNAVFTMSGLEEIAIPKCEKIFFAMFMSCENLKTADFPVAKEIDGMAFSGCSALKSVSLPKVDEIGASAFSEFSAYTMDSLKSIELPATPPTVGANAFQGCPKDRTLYFIDENGNSLTGEALEQARSNYQNDVGWSKDETTNTYTWYGWNINYPVTISVKKDGVPLSGRTIKLVNDSDSSKEVLASEFESVPCGNYSIYDNGTDTGVVIPVNGSVKDFTVDYYTVSFHDGTDYYQDGTDWGPQVAVKNQTIAAPSTKPTKEGYTFEKWVTTPDGEEEFDFSSGITGTTTIYAKWKKNDGTGTEGGNNGNTSTGTEGGDGCTHS